MFDDLGRKPHIIRCIGQVESQIAQFQAVNFSQQLPGGDDLAWRLGADYQSTNVSASLSHLTIGPGVKARAATQ